MSKFKQDLEVGLIAEQEVATLLEERGWLITHNTSKKLYVLRGWDLQGTRDNESIKIEVKNDLLAEKTGNVAIEVKCVVNSISNVWVYKIAGEYFAISLKWLREQVVSDGRFVNGGDNGSSFMKLIPVIEFKENAKQLLHTE